MKFDALLNSINEQWTVSDLVTGPEWNMKGKDAPFKPVTKAQKASRSAGPKLGAVGALLSKAAKKAQAKLASKKELKESVGSVTIKQILKEYTSNWLNENTNEGPDLRLVADLAKQNQTDIKMLVKALRDPDYIATMVKNAGKMITGKHGAKPQKNVAGSHVSKYEQEHPADLKHRLKGLFEKYRAGIKLL